MRNFLIALALAAPLPLQAQITFKEVGRNLEVRIEDRLFTTYRADTRVPCLFPVMSSSGAHLTRQFPFAKGIEGEKADHPHHTGFWFTHGDVNGKDFWHKPDCKIVHKAYLDRKASDKAASFTVKLQWEAGGKSLLDELRTFTFTPSGKAMTIGVQSKLTASGEDVVFGDTKEGSFAIRVAPTLRLKGEAAKGHILTSEGKKDGEAWGKRAKWVAYYGPDGKGMPVSISIFDHPQNLRHPTWWHARDYGLCAANPFGIHDFERKAKGAGDHTLKKGETLVQHYAIHIRNGEIDGEAVETAWKAFAK